MTKLRPWKTASGVLVLCAATGIASLAQTFTTLHSFNGTEGANPYAGLAQATNANLYGTTLGGGANSYGTVFKMGPSGTLTMLHSFDLTDDGGVPYSGVVQATNGDLYGTTVVGGPDGYGTVFKIIPSGTLTTLHSFGGTDGGHPQVGLIQATNGNFYGTTYDGGADNSCTNGCGTVFKMNASGMLTTLHSFNETDGSCPWAGLIQAADGDLYGTTNGGGANGGGTVFKITLSGALTTLHNFDCVDGCSPQGALVQATDGNFYGETSAGGTYESGTVFKMTPSDTLTTLYSFCSQAACTDGGHPYGGLVQATDGNFYGTTSYGGPYQQGTVFNMSPSGTPTTLHSFSGSDLSGPWAGVIQATNGSFYGTTYGGGVSDLGTIFGLDMGLGPFVTFVRPAGKVGQTGGILGQGFTGTTGVSLNGTPAPFTVVSDTFLKATVPPGATTGYVTVTTPNGTLTSNVPFHVIP
jgi:uncharacterized repeat protein (TIGR03803 family)